MNESGRISFDEWMKQDRHPYYDDFMRKASTLHHIERKRYCKRYSQSEVDQIINWIQMMDNRKVHVLLNIKDTFDVSKEEEYEDSQGMFLRGGLLMRIWRGRDCCRNSMIGSTLWSVGSSYHKVQAVVGTSTCMRRQRKQQIPPLVWEYWCPSTQKQE